MTQSSKRVGEDNANARSLALELAKSPLLSLDPDHVESNIVVFELASAAPCTVEELLRVLALAGILMIPFRSGIRAVTHYDVTYEDCKRAGRMTVAVLQRFADGLEKEGAASDASRRGPYG